MMRQVLGAALTRAVREELLSPQRRPPGRTAAPGNQATIRPWSASEAIAFLSAAKADPLYPAFMLLLLYGLRRGEVLGLRWRTSIWTPATFRIRQQLQRVSGELRVGPVKTRAGNRDLPIPGLAVRHC